MIKRILFILVSLMGASAIAQELGRGNGGATGNSSYSSIHDQLRNYAATGDEVFCNYVVGDTIDSSETNALYECTAHDTNRRAQTNNNKMCIVEKAQCFSQNQKKNNF